ncbi:hypothetical protein SpAn4DRAFT_2170 [Sporomusa ovata]|uniref:Uncharacterized protein n=1 Tax=Sporomusa ovata TaxID=2378 RepID=A0A0U1KUU0_9FIRM|nr:hypothetical protein SpAn4DRAFT_2170 [Sporomusa ovata]
MKVSSYIIFKQFCESWKQRDEVEDTEQLMVGGKTGQSWIELWCSRIMAYSPG